jgi:hypothetical protein
LAPTCWCSGASRSWSSSFNASAVCGSKSQQEAAGLRSACLKLKATVMQQKADQAKIKARTFEAQVVAE